jgi:putative hemolysin
MDGDSQAIGLLILGIFIIVSFIMYGFCYAISALNQSEVEKLAEGGDRKWKKIQAIVEQPEKLNCTRQVLSYAMAVFVGYYLLGPYTQYIYGKLFQATAQWLRNGVIWVVAVILVLLYLLFIMLALGMVLPGKLGARHAKTWAYALADVNGVFMTVLTPITWLISLLANLILRIFGIDPHEITDNVTEEEIKSIVSEGHEMGVIEANEAEMIANIFEWGDKEAQDIMTHRKNVTALNGELSLSACIEQMLCGTHTRYPVYDGDIDNVIGVLHLKEAVIGLEQKGYGDWKVKDIPDLLQTPYFIPETRNIDMLFQDMQSKKIHMAVVIDEYGQTAGLISMEDILEEIVGNILDEYDEEKDNIVKTGENTYLIDGMTTLEELEDALDISFEEEDYDTINGYLISELGHIPAEDEKAKITIANYEYEICKVENKMISQVALTILPQEEAAQEEER